MGHIVEFVVDGQPAAADARSEAKVGWQNAVGGAARAAVGAVSPPAIDTREPVQVSIYWFRSRAFSQPPDLDNILKPIIDALAMAKRNQRFEGGQVYQDDGQVADVRAVHVDLRSLPDYEDLPAPLEDLLSGGQPTQPEEFVYIRITVPAPTAETLEFA